jgi:hypothetical protein
MATDTDIIKDYNERYQQANQVLQEFRDEAKTDLEFYLGDQYSSGEKHHLLSNDREIVTNNKIRRAVDLMSGWQRANRRSSIMLPQTDHMIKAADQMSSALQFVYQKRNGYEHISDCFQYGSLITGINFSEILLDFENDPARPDLKFERIPYNGAVWDPYFTKLDMSDCEYFIRRKYVSKAEAANLLPKHVKEIEKLGGVKYGDDKFSDMAFPSTPNNQEMLAYTEFWERVIEERPFLVDTIRDEIITEIKTDDTEFLDTFLGNFPNARIIKRRRSVVKLTIILNEEVMESGRDPLDIGEYPFVPFIGTYIPEHENFYDKIKSWSRDARDPQRELNKRISKFLDILDKKVHSGLFYKPSALIDTDDVYDTGNSSNIGLKKDAQFGRDIMERQPPQMDQGLSQMISLFDGNIMDNLGLNDAAFGSPQSGNDSGLLQQLRQSASMYGAEPYFDSLNLSQHIHSKKVVKAIQRWWDKEKFKRIIGEEPVQEVYDPNFTRFDVNVTQGVLTESQQKMYFLQLVQLRELGVEEVTGSMLAKEAPLQKRSKFLENLEQQEQQRAQQQQQMAEQQQRIEQLQTALVQSQVEENNADTTRKSARAIADIGLTQAHIAEATQKRASATLDMVKASQELIDSREDRIISGMTFINSLMEEERDKDRAELFEDTAIVNNINEQQLPTQQPGV